MNHGTESSRDREVTPVDTRRPDLRSLLAGLALVAASAAFAWTAADYGIGTPRRMGPGFFPFYLGLIGTVLGALMVIRAFTAPASGGTRIPLRRLFFIGAAFLLFALAIEPLGLILTLIGTTFLGAFADEEARPVQSLILAVGLAVAIWVVFVLLLGLTIPVWPGAR